MKAALLKAYGDVDQFAFGDIATPEPGPGEVLIRVEASAVNPFDLFVRQGGMAAHIPFTFPVVLGMDGAGTIAAVGEGVTAFQKGDRVLSTFATNGHGAHAEFAVTPAAAVAPLPASLTFEQGAALPTVGLTGWQVVDALGVKAGDRVLVSGGLGGVGRAVIQHLKELGAKPVAGVRADRLQEGREVAGEALDIGVAPAAASFDLAVSAAAPAAGHLFANVRDGGRVASVVPVPEGANDGNRVTNIQVYQHPDGAMLKAVAEAAARGALVVPISQVFPLDQLGAAQKAAAAGAPGKIVLKS